MQLNIELAEYKLVQWINLLKLNHWRIEFNWDEFVEEEWNEAEVRTQRDYKWAKIKLNRKWMGWTPEKLDHAIVHELMHVHFHDLEIIVEDAIIDKFVSGHVSSNMEEYVSFSFTHAYEAAIDDMAHRLIEIAGLQRGVMPSA